ncbi:Fas ligand L homeolog [Xenopus laevis]|uniref:Tumor necrosis factor ligand superfamily member 6 n=1 Tax=Xenopus laevis TaxID=8355 RepID=B6F0V6_XENLA|nr:Fas ligand L homeolog [Xenopus laevis]BAG80586.1 Fasl [Xenopus laevis]
MQQNMRYAQPSVFWMDPCRNPPLPSQVNMPLPPPFPDFRKKRRKDGTCTYLLIMFLLVLLALFGVGLGTYKIIELQRELDIVKEISGDKELPPALEKLIGLNKHPVEKKESKCAAHVTGKEGSTLPLAWEETFGRAFTSGIQYKNRGLVVNQTGLYFLYTSIYFRSTSCQSKELSHTVFKKSKRYPGELTLMKNTEYQYCTSNNKWGRHSYLGALFNLTTEETLYVNVSDIKLVSFDESRTFFGLYKL